VYVKDQYVEEVMTTLNVSTMVEDAVVAEVSAAVAVERCTVTAPVVLGRDPSNVVVAVEEVVTAEVIELTVVETVGPSGCLILPILRPAYSVNHTFTTPPVSVWTANP